MIQLIDKIRRYVKAVRVMRQADVTWGSVVLFPIRRRFVKARGQINLRNGVSLISPPDEPLLHMFEEIWVNHCYLGDDLKLEPGAAVIDIGAHVGIFALWVATRYPEARVICVEPSARMCDYLTKNLSRNRIESVSILSASCGGQNGDAILYSRGGVEAMNTLFNRDNYGSHFQPGTRHHVVTLDDVFARFKIDKCALLKLDCEGAEYEILFNAKQETLAKIDIVSMEYHVGLNEHKPLELERFLESHGFTVEILPLTDVENGYLYARRRP